MENPVLSVIQKEKVDIEELFCTLSQVEQIHSERVGALSELLLGWAAQAVPEDYGTTVTPGTLRKAAKYHDIGLTLVPPRLLYKEGDLTGPEYHVIQQHVHYGSSLLDNYRRTLTGVAKQDRFWSVASEIALGHHERWDGKGYPFGQLTTGTPDVVRVVSVVDAFDSIVYGGHYRMPLPVEYAVLEIIQNAGKQFDPTLAELMRINYNSLFSFYQNWGGI